MKKSNRSAPSMQIFILKFLALLIATNNLPSSCECFLIGRPPLNRGSNLPLHSTSSISTSSSLHVSTTTPKSTNNDQLSQSPLKRNKRFSPQRIIDDESFNTVVEEETKAKSSSSSSSTAKKSKQTTMTFIGTKQVQTKPISIPKSTSTIQNLNDFFSVDSNRNLLFPTNNAQTLHLNQINNRLIDTWQKEAALGGGTGPANTSSFVDDNSRNKFSVFKIDAPLQMPGLKIISESTIGMKLTLSDGEYPEYQFTLLDSHLIPSGPAPLVWLFQKLTQYRDTTSSFTKVRAEAVPSSTYGSDNSSEIVFVTDARLETRMHLPSTLLKLLPNVNIAKFEKQGSDAVQRLLERELEPALNIFSRAFCSFVEER